MNIIPFSIARYINIILSGAFILAVVSFKSTSSELGIIILGILGNFSNIFTFTSWIAVKEQAIKLTILGTFLVSLLSTFSGYIFQFTTNKPLFYATLAYSGLLLISIFITKLDITE
jgi:hypothetical protein